MDPKDRLMILNRYYDDTRKIRVFISRKQRDAWSQPVAVPALDLPEWALTPCLSPDGKYLLFTQRGVIHHMDFDLRKLAPSLAP
ncbi:MAG: hypothetical protein K2X35_05770 [Bryobacteraceae bacterium]|nr:hypothetical protein [Bryobacteraceae bacterium]